MEILPSTSLSLITIQKARQSPAMPETLLQYGLPALLLVSFGAATLLPLGSEWLLAALVLNGSEPVAAVVVATIGNTLGAATNYVIGRWGATWGAERFTSFDAQRQLRAQSWFRRYGDWSLLLSWMPIIGDPLCLISGVVKTPLSRFFALVVCAKGLRYICLVLMLPGTP